MNVPARVVAIEADKVRVPFRRPFPTAVGMWLDREAWIVRLVDDDGRTGAGEAVLEPADGDTAHAVLDHLVREAVRQAAEGDLPSPSELEIHGAPGRALRAALDAAAFDLRGVVPELLRADGSGVGVNATIASVGPRESAEAARQAVEAGFRTLKLKAGAERETEALVDRLAAVRDAVGPSIRLRLDVNGAWDLDTAERRLDAIARFGIEYVEQPLAPEEPADLARLRRRVDVPVAADEAVASVAAARDLLEATAVDVLVVKLARVGGLEAAAQIAERAAERGVPVVISTRFETGVGVAAALVAAAALPVVRGFERSSALDHGLATAGLLEHDLLVDALPVADGRMHQPGAPSRGARGGLGVTLHDRAVARYTVESVRGGDR